MREIDKYTNLWKRYLPVIRILMKRSISESQTLRLQKHEFVVTGEREVSGYGFNLELDNGKATSNISGSAVARDLRDVIVQDPNAQEIISRRKFKLNLDSNFVLHIQNIK